MANVVQTLTDSRAEEREWALRCDMAAVFRIGARLGWNEHIGNHNSLMLPDEAEPRFLINPRGYLFQELRASDLIVCDLDGNVLKGKGELRKVTRQENILFFWRYVPRPVAQMKISTVH